MPDTEPELRHLRHTTTWSRNEQRYVRVTDIFTPEGHSRVFGHIVPAEARRRLTEARRRMAETRP